jgi:uncharacterized protein YcfL
MKTAILLLFLFSFIFVGCANEEPQIVFKDKLVCVEQQTIPRVEETQIRVYKDDVNIALAYKESINSGFSFYKGQVDRNNRLCEQINEIGANK